MVSYVDIVMVFECYCSIFFINTWHKMLNLYLQFLKEQKIDLSVKAN